MIPQIFEPHNAVYTSIQKSDLPQNKIVQFVMPDENRQLKQNEVTWKEDSSTSTVKRVPPGTAFYVSDIASKTEGTFIGVCNDGVTLPCHSIALQTTGIATVLTGNVIFQSKVLPVETRKTLFPFKLGLQPEKRTVFAKGIGRILPTTGTITRTKTNKTESFARIDLSRVREEINVKPTICWEEKT